MVVREQEAAEARHRREAVEGDAEHGAAWQQRAAVGTCLERAKHHVDSVLRGGADDQRQRPDVDQIEAQAAQLHDADRPQRSEQKRNHGDHGLPEPPDHQRGNAGHEHEGVDHTVTTGPLHHAHRLVRDDRLAGDIRIDRAQLFDEPGGARALPDVLARVDLHEQPARRADELALQHIGQSGHGHRPRPHHLTQPFPVLRKVRGELPLEIRQGDLREPPVTLVQLPEQRGGDGRGGVRGLREPPVQARERLDEGVDVEAWRRTDDDVVDDGGDASEKRKLFFLARRKQGQRALHVRHGGQPLERHLLGAQLLDRAGRRQGGEARAAGRRRDLLFPDDGLRVRGLQVQEVVVEAHARRRPQGDRGGNEHQQRAAHRTERREESAGCRLR